MDKVTLLIHLSNQSEATRLLVQQWPFGHEHGNTGVFRGADLPRPVLAQEKGDTGDTGCVLRLGNAVSLAPLLQNSESLAVCLRELSTRANLG